jgi:hypothetical protein
VPSVGFLKGERKTPFQITLLKHELPQLVNYCCITMLQYRNHVLKVDIIALQISIDISVELPDILLLSTKKRFVRLTNFPKYLKTFYYFCTDTLVFRLRLCIKVQINVFFSFLKHPSFTFHGSGKYSNKSLFL